MMKKFVALVLSLMMLLSLAACGNKEDNPADGSTPAPTQTVKPEGGNTGDTDKKVTPEPGKDNTGEPTSEPSAPDTMSVSDEQKSVLAQWTLVDPMGDDSYWNWEFRELAYSGWQYSGALVNGVEQPSDNSERYEIIFDSMPMEVGGAFKNLVMNKGSDTFAGDYTILDDGYMMHLVLENLKDSSDRREYIGALVSIDDEAFLVLFPDSTGKNVLYFTHISEC